MADSTILNFLKENSTVLNNQTEIIIDPTGQTVANHYVVEARMNTLSGEADLYSCTDQQTGSNCVFKLYSLHFAVNFDFNRFMIGICLLLVTCG
jgi:hypothetical protein